MTVSGVAPGTLRFDGTGLTFTSTSTQSAGTVLSFSGTTTSVGAALTTGRITWVVPEQPGQVTLSASVRQDLPANTRFNPANGHYYQQLTTSGTWDAASASAASRELWGLSGYLTTIMNGSEQDFLASWITSGQWWIGATDRRLENVWEWVTGPEGEANGGLGTVFWTEASQSRGQRGTVTVNGTPRFA